MSKPTLFLIITLFVFTAGLLMLALNKPLNKPKQVIQPPTPSISPILPASNAAVAETSLLFGSLDITSPFSMPKKYIIPIEINTGSNKVTSVQLELSFDPNILTKVNITPSTFFKNPNVILNKINYDIGKISYALTSSESAMQKSDTLATIFFESAFTISSNILSGSDSAKAKTFTTFTFLPKTFVTAEGLEQSALKSTNSAELLLK